MSRSAGQIIERGNRTFLVRVYAGQGANGKRRYVNKTVYGTKKEAQQALTKLLHDRDTDQLTTPSKRTVAEHVSEWRDKALRGRVAARTFDSYTHLLEKHVLPVIGEKRLTALTTRDVQGVYAGMLSSGLSARTVRYAHAVLRNALAQAVKWRLLRYNPAIDVDLPRERRAEREALTSDERARFLEACKASYYGVFYRALVDTGMRPGEACALRWTDVDFARGTITVARAVTRGQDGEAIFAEPKTAKSRRTIPMLGGLRDELLAHLDWQRSTGLDAEGLVFTNQSGVMLRPWTFARRDLERTALAAGIAKSVSLYSLRHTFATLHVAAGTPLKVVSDVLGHSTIQQTADTYMHGDQAVTSEWMQRFERAVVTTLEGRQAAN
jgi:integrase